MKDHRSDISVPCSTKELLFLLAHASNTRHKSNTQVSSLPPLQIIYLTSPAFHKPQIRQHRGALVQDIACISLIKANGY